MRVISLLPAATDTIVALGGEALLVGVSHSCDAAAVRGIVRVTASAVDPDATSGAIDAAVREIASAGRPFFALNHDAIARLEPDLIITQGLCEVCAVSDGEVRALAATLASKPAVLSLSGSSVDGVLADIAAIGAAVGLADDADELVLGLRARMRTVHGTLKAARAPRPRVATIEWTDPLFTGGHWVPEQVRRAGGVDVLAEPGTHSRVIGVDVLERADPDIVLVAPCGFGVPRAQTEAQRLVATAPWLRGRRVWALDGNALTSRPGPRIIDGIETMARIFAPNLFTPVEPGMALQVA